MPHMNKAKEEKKGEASSFKGVDDGRKHCPSI